MPHYPYTRLIVGAEKALAVSGPHFHVLSVQTGKIIHTTTQLHDDAQGRLTKSGPIRCAAVDATFTHVIQTADDKKLKVWLVGEDFKLLSERELPKKPTEIGFTRDGQTIIVSDKFGDVFSYPLHPDPATASSTSNAGASKRGSLTAHENPSNGTLILGHASMLTTYLLTQDEQFIITADRDEHIRVSWWPKGYVIERYCLGQERFVSALHIPSFDHALLVSGGGDPYLKVWDWLSGKALSEIAVSQAVEPYIKVRAPKWRHGWNDGDGEGEEGAAEGKGKGKGKGRRKGKGKKADQELPAQDASAEQEGLSGSQTPVPAGENTDIPMVGTDTPSSTEDGSHNAPKNSDETNLVFAVHRIQTVDRGEHGRFVVFSAVGATAVFYVPFPANGEQISATAVQAVDLGKPVVDFTLDQQGNVWVLTDSEWSGPSDATLEGASPVRLLTWDGSKLSESTSAEAPLLTALKSRPLLSATPAELKVLDLYAALSSLPKNVDPEHDPLIRDTLSEAAVAAPSGEDGKPLTQRELGRLRKKKALLAKIQAQEQQTRGASREGSAATDGSGEGGGREVKRARSESAAEGSPDAGAGRPAASDVADKEAQDVEMSVS
ncbi:hypothetical protein BD413DRAFT_540191 [Trametes elegans]|nr:hypothetical protein BD413DRAFT_540191 [Trametes elegans]